MAMNLEPLLERLKREQPPNGIVTRYLGQCGPRDLDGVRYKLYATDGNSAGPVELEMTGSEGGSRFAEIEPSRIEAAAERKAGQFPAQSRAASMIAYSQHIGPIPLHRGDL
jgi:hypothetical protein